MGLFDTLKLAKEAMKPANVKQGLAASKQMLANPMAGPTEEQLAALTPEQRAAYDANMARIAEAQAQAAATQRELVDQEIGRRALYGPAGEYVYGDLPAHDAADAPTVEGELAKTKEQFADLLRNPFGRSKPDLPPTAPTGPVDRHHQATTELAARHAAREPYLAPERHAVASTRIVTRRKSQLEEVRDHLAASGLARRPDLVYGLYRVPDDIGAGTLRLRKGSHVIEWEIVHAAPATGLAPSEPPAHAFFESEERWVGRRPGEPSVLDEDLALDYLTRAGVRPEECLGIARLLEIDHHSHGDGDGGGGSSYVVTQVTGVAAFHSAARGGGVFDRMRAERPLATSPTPGVHIEVLNWAAIASAVHPERHRPYLVPSPFPELPSTAQELLRSYLDIVGIRPADSYGVQVTEDDARDIMGVSRKGFMTLNTNRGYDEVCADGEVRPRLSGGARVVVVYRDRPEYAAGRERWAVYERDVLHAALAHGTHVRRPVTAQSRLERGALGKLFDAAEGIYNIVEALDNSPFEKIPPFRYCWPPTR